MYRFLVKSAKNLNSYDMDPLTMSDIVSTCGNLLNL